MPTQRSSFLRSTGVAVGTVALLSGGLAVAPSAAAGSTTVVKACAKKKTGELRLVKSRKKCTRKERFVTWSVTGPQGAQGPAGAPGTPGPSHTYWASSGGAPTGLTNTPTTVVSTTVPAGKYLVQANTFLFQPTGIVPLLGTCRLLADGTAIDADLVGAALFDPTAPDTALAAPLTVTLSAAAATTVAYSCSAVRPGNTLQSQFATLSLVEVGALN